MLVLTRKHQEKIRIGDDITITVLKTKGKAVRLGIEAPAEVPVIRGELVFQNQAIAWQAEPDGSEVAAPHPDCRDHPHADRAQGDWPARSEPRVQVPRLPGSTPTGVSLHRVPREQVRQVLPALVPGAGPLRAMLDRRSATV